MRKNANLFPVVARLFGDDRRPKPVHVIACRACGAEQVVSAAIGHRLSDDVMASRFRRMGWDVGATGRHHCPDCVRLGHGGKHEKARGIPHSWR